MRKAPPDVRRGLSRNKEDGTNFWSIRIVGNIFQWSDERLDHCNLFLATFISTVELLVCPFFAVVKEWNKSKILL